MSRPALSNPFPQFPKTRPPLPPAFQAIYEEHYARNREGATAATSLSSRLERWLHRTVAADLPEWNKDPSTLEIGAGTLNHLPYEPGVRHYDIVEPFQYLVDRGADPGRVSNRYRDIREVPAATVYDRILAIATFEHITDLPEVVARCVRLLSPEGSLRVSIPNEGTLLWWLGTRVTGFEFRKMYGLDYQVLMHHEHVNTAAEIESILRHFFVRVQSRSFGLSKHLAFYRFFECRNGNQERARAYLEKKTAL